jgi:DNA-binding NarL/FixJ family response regulator
MKILIVDQRQPVREALRFYINFFHPDWIINEADTLTELLTQVENECVDTILIDWELNPQNEVSNPLPHVSWKNIIAAIRRYCPILNIIVMSCNPEVQQDALSAGADRFLNKIASPDILSVILAELEIIQLNPLRENNNNKSYS